MRFLQPCRLLILGIWLLVLMVLGFTIQLMGTHCQKRANLSAKISHSVPEDPQDCRQHRTEYVTPLWGQELTNVRSTPEVRKLMPADSFYFTILRDPATLAESSFSYYRSVSSAFKKAPNFTEFIAHPSHYYKPGEKGNQHARNFQWFDLGLNPDTPFNESVAKAGVGGIERTFHLVLLSEYFDESMVLLKEELCWDLDDVVTFKLNTREASTPLEKREVERLRAWNALDWYLYVHFNRTFWEKVERFGRERMDTEVRRLRERRQELAEICLEGSNPVRADQIREEGIRPYQFGKLKILGWVVKRDLEPDTRARCVQMVTPELRYKDILDEKQFPGADIAGSDLSQQGSQ
uniref:Galactose-3-O-sulfotransferase 4 n=1 Tax=Xenopus tropicalis TaxID=8364 RepID=A0A1B8Y8Y9_XENTR